MNKNIFFITLILGLNFTFAQENYLIVNNDSISVSNFKKLYRKNIEAEGIQNALNSYIDFKLLSQNAIIQQVDTTSYYINNYKNFIETESKNYLEKNDLKESIAKKIYEGLKNEKKIEVFFFNYNNPFNEQEISGYKNELLFLQKKICADGDSTVLKKYREKYQSEPFWLKPLSISYKMIDLANQTKINECSPIIKDDFGTYFIKVYDEKTVDYLPPYEQIQDQIIQNISTSSYQEILEDDLVERLNQKIKLSEDTKALNQVLNVAKNKLFKSDNLLDFKGDEVIWQTNYSFFTQQDLVNKMNEIIAVGTLGNETNFDLFINYAISSAKKKFLIESYQIHLQDFEPQFKKQVNLMKETLLVNYFVENYIYSEAKKDSIGQQKFLMQHKDKYTWPLRYDLSIYRYFDDNLEDKLYQLLKNQKSDDEILKQLNSNKSNIKVVLTNGKLRSNHPDLPKNFNPNKKIQKIKYLTQNAFYVLNEILQPKTMTVDEAGYSLKDSYQSFYYDNKLKELRNEAFIYIPKEMK